MADGRLQLPQQVAVGFARLRFERTNSMALWFVPPVFVPLGLIFMIVAYAIYRAYAHPPARLQAISARATTAINMPDKPLRGWRS
jgi:hypothetical protein